jgi:membrane fusion protein
MFLGFATYSRIETVTGTIAPATGVAAIVPGRSGVISGLSVQDGQIVAAGAELAAVRAEEDSATGVPPAAQIEAAMTRQDASLAAQIGATRAAAQAQLSQLVAQRSGLEAEIVQLQSQIVLQRDLVGSAQRDLDRVRPVSQRGFISARDLQLREETLLARQQGLSQLSQTLAVKRAAIVEAERNALQIASQSRAQSASLTASRAEVAQQAASAAGARSYVIRAPIAGYVTALTARVGQPANPQTPLMSIIPAESPLRAELTISSSAIGFVKVGQEVRLAIDAFPYQKFGTITGRILTVATSATPRVETVGGARPGYPVTVALNQAGIEAYGRREPLVSGMSLTARIVTEKQSLLTWLFEPVYAVWRR